MRTLLDRTNPVIRNFHRTGPQQVPVLEASPAHSLYPIAVFLENLAQCESTISALPLKPDPVIILDDLVDICDVAMYFSREVVSERRICNYVRLFKRIHGCK